MQTISVLTITEGVITLDMTRSNPLSSEAFTGEMYIKVFWDSRMRVMRWSSGAEIVFGWKANEVIGRSLDEWPFINSGYLLEARRVMARVAQGNIWRDIARIPHYRKDGSPLWCEWYSYPVRDRRHGLMYILAYGTVLSGPDGGPLRSHNAAPPPVATATVSAGDPLGIEQPLPPGLA